MAYDPNQYLTNTGQTQFAQSSQSYEQLAALYAVAQQQQQQQQQQHFVNTGNQTFSRPG